MDSQLPLRVKEKGMADFRSKRLKSIKMKACLVCFLSLSTLFAAGTATFAWFTTNKTARGTYSNIVANDTSIIESVKYYAIKTCDLTANTYTFSTESTNNYEMPKYDREFSNGENKLLIEVNFKDSATKFSLKGIAKNSLFKDKTWTGDNCGVDWSTNDSGNKFPLSAIIQFNYFTSGTVDETNNRVTVTKTADTADHTFVTLTDSNPEYSQTITLADNQTGLSKVYIMLDYFQEAITEIYSANIGNEIFNGDYSTDSSSSSSSTSIIWGVDFSLVFNAL